MMILKDISRVTNYLIRLNLFESDLNKAPKKHVYPFSGQLNWFITTRLITLNTRTAKRSLKKIKPVAITLNLVFFSLNNLDTFFVQLVNV